MEAQLGAAGFLVPPGWLPAVVASAGLSVSIGIVVVAAILRLRERRVPASWAPASAFALGIGASVMVTSWTAHQAWTATIFGGIVAAVPAALMVMWRRFDLAGWYVVGVVLPMLAWWGFLAVQGVRADGAAGGVPAAWAAGALGLVLLGWIGIRIGSRVPDPQPPPPPSEPDPGRAVSIATAMQRELRFGPLDLPNAIAIGLAIGGSAVAAMLARSAGADPPGVSLVSLGVAVLLATELFYHAWPRRLRLAMAAHAFLGSWEMRRFVSMTGTKPPTSPDAAGRWLEAHPETDANRSIRPELLAWIGRFDEAYEVLGRLPASTDEDRFERLAIEAFLDVASGRRPADMDGLAEAAERIGQPDSDERLRAVAAVAVTESRRRLANGEGEWIGPLLEAQERIGVRSLGIQRADTWMLRFRSLAITFGALLLLATLVGLLPT